MPVIYTYFTYICIIFKSSQFKWRFLWDADQADLMPLSAVLHRTGESQYRAFLLLKALQTVARSYTAQRGLRVARASAGNPAGTRMCGLRSLTVSLERYVAAPDTENIRNCYGSCTYPMNSTTNHAVLLESHIKMNPGVDERAPCCVPVAYDDLLVVDFTQPRGTFIGTKTNAVARECECR